MSQQVQSSASEKLLFGHPMGLYILFLTEMWERFSYYGMRALLVLFLTASVTAENAGYGWSNEEALALYGWYTMLVYVLSIPGGILADKWLGQKKVVMIGGILLCIGHSVLALEALWAFYVGCMLIILGVGCLKANISTMVGGLYKEGDERRDKGFYIFYMGINSGAFLGGIIVGSIGENINWHYGFGLAGIGMLIGQVIYICGQKYLIGVGERIVEKEEQNTKPSIFVKLFQSRTPLLVTALLLFSWIISITLLMSNGHINIGNGIAYGLLLGCLILFFGMGMVVYSELTLIEKDRVLVLLLSLFLVIVFWGAFEQAGGLINIYTKEKTDRFTNLLTLDVVFIIGIAFLTIKGIIGQIRTHTYHKWWYVGAIILVLIYVLLRYYEFSNPYEIPASVFQSLNPFFITTLAIPIAGFWYNRKMKNKQASSLFKIAIGVIIMGWGFFFMSAASIEFENNGSSAMYWLVLAYLFHTVGELCSSPVSLSFFTKLAPLKYGGIMMGVYFATTGLGNKLAGVLGEWSQSVGELHMFTGIAIFCTLFALGVLAILKPLIRLTHGTEDLKN